jgi:hypothetical protein
MLFMNVGETKSMKLPNGAARSYMYSFGDWDEGTRYSGLGISDLRPGMHETVNANRQAHLKALTVNGMSAGTAGSSLVPVYVDPVIVDQSRKYTPWVEIVPRVTNMGTTADFNVISAKGAAKTLFEDATLTDVTDTESRSSTAIKYLYSVGRVTGQTIAAMPPYTLSGMVPMGAGFQGTTYANASAPNAKQYEIQKRARALKELEENLFWNGNKTTSGISGNANGTEYDGVIALQGTTNKTDLNTSAMSWSNVETSIKDAYDDSGRPSVAGCSSSVYTDLRSILIDAFRLRPSDMGGGEVSAGIASRLTLETMVGPVAVIPTQYLSNTSGSKAIYFLDMDVWEHRVLMDMTYFDLAVTNDSEKFALKQYQALITRNAAFNSFIGEIA